MESITPTQDAVPTIPTSRMILRPCGLGVPLGAFHRCEDPNEGPYFRPLEYNRPACQINTTWTEGGYSHHANSGTVIVPYGTCVWMDYSSEGIDQEQEMDGDHHQVRPVLVLPHGIDIQGHLYFPDISPRLPAHNNVRICPNATRGEPGTCDIGFRSMVVAGGTILMQGVPPACTTWTRLDHVRGARRRRSTSPQFLLLHSAPAVTTTSPWSQSLQPKMPYPQSLHPG